MTTGENNNCDRRLSRAARSLLHEKLLTFPTVKSMDLDPSSWSVWQLLSYVLDDPREKIQASPSCPLLPELDLWKEHELNSAVQSYDPINKKDQRTVSGLTSSHFARIFRREHPYIYQCLYCQKSFTSRYYLDLHQSTHHPRSKSHNATSTTNNNSTTSTTGALSVCPATTWCQFLSMTACHQRALQDEPYYGRGSNGRRKDRYKVEAKLWKEEHAVPCTVAAANAARQTCHRVGELCFASTSPENKEFWHQQVCNTASLSCPSHLQQLYFRSRMDGDLILRQVHEWQQDWTYWYQEHHNVGWMGRLLLLALCAYYIRFAYQQWKRYRRNLRPAPRLLRSKAKRL